ncbi:hypothetical protein QBC38DRAFT_62339 [Podospora fimiseda]|uniref:Uncharacterized protein n=1 Tax=Podospora fimiseda TaxID=252190 RepID=A0AAN7BV10_9PEZI|nr:hypothetical protein QBC38DRAFT_62339 [Podospora fimiseda]
MSAAKNALAFFTFQMTLQIEFQEAMLEERERYWNFEVTKVFTEASRKIKRLQAKVAGLEETRDNLRQKNEELVLELEDSREQFTRLQTQHHNSRNRITFDLDPTGATHFEDTAAGKDSRLPHMPMPDQLRNTQGSYFPSDTDYPDPDENDHLERTREKTHQARHISRRTHPTGTGAIPGDWNTGPRRDTSIAITKPKGAGITKTSKHISGHKFTRAVSFDQARNRPPSPTAPPEQQVQESSRRFSGAQFGFTSSRAPQQARDTISPKPGGLERRSFRAVPPTTAVERTSTFNRPPLLRRQRLD